MCTNYFDGFTEAMVRNLCPPEAAAGFEVHTSTITYDEWRADVARPLRIGWSGRYRITIVTDPRGVLLLEELHIPLATEIAAAFDRLDAVEQLVREALPAVLADTARLQSGVVVYGNDLDVVPRDERLEPVHDENLPRLTLEPLFERLFDDSLEPEVVDEVFEWIRQTWDTYGRDDWLAEYHDVDAA